MTALNPVLFRTELRRSLRNPRYAIFTMVVPLLVYLVFAPMDDGTEKLDGLNGPAYFMVSMGVFGAMGAVIASGGQIAVERGHGWLRQLRLTALTGRRYIVTKALTGFAMALPALVLVYAAAITTQDVRMPWYRFALAAGWTLLALAPLAALGVLLGYLANADSLQAITGGLSFILSMVGGIWIPVEHMPTFMAHVARNLPVYWVTEAGRAPLNGTWVGWHGLSVLAAWTVGLGVLAAKRHRADAKRA